MKPLFAVKKVQRRRKLFNCADGVYPLCLHAVTISLQSPNVAMEHRLHVLQLGVRKSFNNDMPIYHGTDQIHLVTGRLSAGLEAGALL